MGAGGKGIDPIRVRSALAVVKQHPVMVTFVAAPVLLGLVLVGVLISKPLAVLLPVGLVRFGGSALLRRRA